MTGIDLVKLSNKDIQEYRGKEIAMIFQDPMTSLNPVYTIKNQMVEVILRHMHITKEKALEEASLIKEFKRKRKSYRKYQQRDYKKI